MMEHEATGNQTRLAKTMARKGCKALGPRCGNGLGHGHGVQVFNRAINLEWKIWEDDLDSM